MIEDAQNGDRKIKKTVSVKKKYLLDIKRQTDDLIDEPFTKNDGTSEINQNESIKLESIKKQTKNKPTTESAIDNSTNIMSENTTINMTNTTNEIKNPEAITNNVSNKNSNELTNSIETTE